jgi:hypothetical protein
MLELIVVDSTEIAAIWRYFLDPLRLDPRHRPQEGLRSLHDLTEHNIRGLAVLHFASARRHNSVAVRAREAVEIGLVSTQSARRMNRCPLPTREHHVVIVTLLQFSHVVEETGNEALADLT